MTIIKTNGTEPFCWVSVHLAQDDRLSVEARGAALYLLSKPNDLRGPQKDLMQHFSIGRDKAARIIRELREAGYLQYNRSHGTDGQYTGGEFTLTDSPSYPQHGLSVSRFNRNPVSWNHNPENPHLKPRKMDSPDGGNQPPLESKSLRGVSESRRVPESKSHRGKSLREPKGSLVVSRRNDPISLNFQTVEDSTNGGNRGCGEESRQEQKSFLPECESERKANGEDCSASNVVSIEKQQIQRAYELYNLVAKDCGLPIARSPEPTPDRYKKIKARLKDHGMRGYKRMLRNLTCSDFLLGYNDRGWRADLDFVLQPKSFNRIIEEFYIKEARPET